MASLIEGMFSDSDAFRQKRISDLQEQSERRKQMSLLNQVAAGRGAQIAEGIGGMFGLKTAQEDKADQIKDMASNLNLETPQGLALFARMLNNQGMTEEAMKVFELAKAREESELNRQVKEKSLKDRNIKVINSYYDPIKGATVNEYGYWDPELGKVVKLSPSEAAAVEGQEGDVKIGTTAKSLQESWGG